MSRALSLLFGATLVVVVHVVVRGGLFVTYYN